MTFVIVTTVTNIIGMLINIDSFKNLLIYIFRKDQTYHNDLSFTVGSMELLSVFRYYFEEMILMFNKIEPNPEYTPESCLNQTLNIHQNPV
jgi:hypothetical protein